MPEYKTDAGPAVVQNPDISKQSDALPLRRCTRLCLQFSDSPISILCLSHIGVKLAEVSSALESCRICKKQMPAAAAFRPRMLEIPAVSRLARHSAGKKLEHRPSRRWEEARLSEHGWRGLSDLYEPYLLSKEMSGNKHKMGGVRLLEHGWRGLFDLYEPYLLSKSFSMPNLNLYHC